MLDFFHDEWFVLLICYTKPVRFSIDDTNPGHLLFNQKINQRRYIKFRCEQLSFFRKEIAEQRFTLDKIGRKKSLHIHRNKGIFWQCGGSRVRWIYNFTGCISLDLNTFPHILQITIGSHLANTPVHRTMIR